MNGFPPEFIYLREDVQTGVGMTVALLSNIDAPNLSGAEIISAVYSRESRSLSLGTIKKFR